MLNLAALREEYGLRIERVIAESPTPKEAMEEIAIEAERVGLIDSRTLPRRSSPEEFVMDLWTENPATLDRLNLSCESLPPPKEVRSLADVLDVLR